MSEIAYTTFQISKMCHVTHRTILLWITQGKIKAFKTPGGHSRVRESDLKTFFREYNMPLPAHMREIKSDIIIVDDEEDICTILKKALLTDKDIKDRVSIITAPNGIDALLHIGKTPPAMVLLDMYLPYLNGFEVCRRIRANEELKGCYIIAMSGHQEDSVKKEAMDAGANVFFSKPFEIEKLKKTVKDVVLCMDEKGAPYV